MSRPCAEDMAIERECDRNTSLERISQVLGIQEGEEFTPISESLLRLADAAERIADALERAYPEPRPDHAGAR